MRPPLRIAVLECDGPIGQTREKYGTYGNLFKELLETSAVTIQEKPELDITAYDVVNAELFPKLENIDAVLLTGSKFNSFDNDPWILKLVEFVEKVLAQDRVRLIGVCFGHQIIGRALGVKVGRSDKGWEVSVTHMQLTAKGKEVFGIEELSIHQMHRDAVYECPKGIELLGYSPRCDVHGLYAKKRLISVQGHPEFTGEIVSELLDTRHEQGIFDDKMYEEAMERVSKHHDGVTVASAFLRFLLEE